MTKPSRLCDAAPVETEASGSSTVRWIRVLEGLLGLPGGALNRDLPGEGPGLFGARRRNAQAEALARVRRDGRGPETAADLRSAASDGGPADPRPR